MVATKSPSAMELHRQLEAVLALVQETQIVADAWVAGEDCALDVFEGVELVLRETNNRIRQIVEDVATTQEFLYNESANLVALDNGGVIPSLRNK
jgi:uncharacterized protein YllA (UPF0747 family)